MANKPVIVLIPGAWHPVALYSPLTTRLEAAGYEVHPVDYPSTGPNPTHPNFEPDLKVVGEALEKIADTGADIVLVVHSAGGIIGGSSAKGFSKTDREKAGKKGGIVHLVYIAAFAAPEGVSLYEATNGAPSWQPAEGPVVRVLDPKDHFYNCCPDDVAEEMSMKLQLFSLGTMWSKATYAPWKHIPGTYLLCENDRAIDPQGQEGMAAQDGAQFEVLRCKADHSPFLCMPDFTANVVRRAAGEKIDLE